jgi:hypothetical protein
MSANPASASYSGPRAAHCIERRQNGRQPLEAMGVLGESSPASARGHLQVMMMNISPGGVGFGSPVAFRPGMTYSMRIGTGALHLKANLQIISSRPRRDGSFQVGAKFV